MDSLKTPKFSENTENGEARRRNPPPPIYRGEKTEDFFGGDENHQHPTTSPADHPAKGVASFGDTGAHPRLKRESYDSPEGVPEVQQTPDRLARFHALGLPDPEALAARLAHRDRDLDDRRLCLECRHLSGHTQGAWRCSNWPKAGMVAIRAVYAQLPAELVTKLQRCDGFELIPNPESKTP